MNAVQKAVDILGSQANLARVCGQRPQAVTRWLREGRVPAKYASAVAAATKGEVSCHQLRPDVFPAEQSGQDSTAAECADAHKAA